MSSVVNCVVVVRAFNGAVSVLEKPVRATSAEIEAGVHLDMARKSAMRQGDVVAWFDSNDPAYKQIADIGRRLDAADAVGRYQSQASAAMAGVDAINQWLSDRSQVVKADEVQAQLDALRQNVLAMAQDSAKLQLKLQQLTQAAKDLSDACSGDIFTDAPECGDRVDHVRACGGRVDAQLSGMGVYGALPVADISPAAMGELGSGQVNQGNAAPGLQFSLDSGLTWLDAPAGVRVVLSQVEMDDWPGFGEAHFNIGLEGVVTDLYVGDGCVGTESDHINDIVARLYEVDGAGDSNSQKG